MPAVHTPWLARLAAAITLAAAPLVAGCSLYFTDDDPPADDDPPLPAARCAPAAITRASDVAPDLRAWILAAESDACALDHRTSAGVPDGFPTTLDAFPAPGTLTCGDDGCWVALPALARAWSHHPAPAAFTYDPDPLGEQWTGMVAAARHQTTGELRATLIAMQYGSSAVRRFERRWDRAGHLLAERELWNGAVWFTVDNTWAGDHLIASRYVDAINRTGETTYAWTYDGDRLIAASAHHVDSDVRAGARFQRDGAGRLVAIDRTIDGQPWAHQTWRYDGDRVAGATTALEPAAHEAARLVWGTDDLVPVTFAGTQPAWDAAAGLVVTAAGCAPLPHGLLHGYPVADGGYALGWAVGDRPDGIDGDYGFGGVYDVAIDRWFGHDRVEAYVFNQPWRDAAVVGELSYDARGRMVREAIATADGALTATRTRSFDGGVLVDDRRTLARDGVTLTSRLDFRHDDAGRLIERSYRLDDHLAARHAWTYDGDAVRRHTIATAPVAPFEAGFPLSIPDVASLPAALPPAIVHERIVDGDGVTWLREGLPLEVRQLDDAGRLRSRRRDPGSVELFTYEPRGELASYAHTATTGEVFTRLGYERDGAGRLTARTWAYGTHGDRDQFTYACR